MKELTEALTAAFCRGIEQTRVGSAMGDTRAREPEIREQLSELIRPHVNRIVTAAIDERRPKIQEEAIGIYSTSLEARGQELKNATAQLLVDVLEQVKTNLS